MTAKKKGRPRKDKGPFTYKFEVSLTSKNEIGEDRRDQIGNSILRLVQSRECWYARVQGVHVKEITDKK